MMLEWRQQIAVTSVILYVIGRGSVTGVLAVFLPLKKGRA